MIGLKRTTATLPCLAVVVDSWEDSIMPPLHASVCPQVTGFTDHAACLCMSLHASLGRNPSRGRAGDAEALPMLSPNVRLCGLPNKQV